LDERELEVKTYRIKNKIRNYFDVAENKLTIFKKKD